MKFYKILIIISTCLAFSTVIYGQQLKENEVIVIKGEKYVLHQVRTGETMYSLEKKFRVDSITLITHNPHIAEEELKIGEILKIPLREDVDLREQPVYIKGDPTYFDYYTITSRRETPYFIAKAHGITVEEIFAYNPEVEKFRKGIKIRIPRWETLSGKEPAKETEPDSEVVTERETVKAEEQVSGQKEIELIRHTVNPGETLFSLSRKYGVSESEILFYNPDAKDLKAGSILYIPQPERPLADVTLPETPPEGQFPLSEGQFFEHTIVSGETLWSLSRRFGVTEEELIGLNPVLKEEFPAGITIRVPVKESSLVQAEPVNEDAFEKHIVKPGETLFGLAEQYRVTIPDIKKFNPVLEKRNLVTGETLLIPKTEEKEVVTFNEESTNPDTVTMIVPQFDDDYYEVKFADKIPASCLPRTDQQVQDKIYNIVLFLPLYINDNELLNREYDESADSQQDSAVNEFNNFENDSVIEPESIQKFHDFYQDSENFIMFYEGVLLAIDSMQRTGMKIRLDVFDTQMKLDHIRNQISRINFLNTDLIIGPVYPQVQREIASLASKNRVPIVSPLASQSEVLVSNPYYYQVNPDRDILDIKTAELIAEEYFNSNFIVFKTRSGGDEMSRKVPEMIRERLLHTGYYGQAEGFNFNIYDFNHGGAAGISSLLSHDKENVIFIPSMDEGQISVALSNINNFAGEYSITLIGFNRYQQFKSINIELFHNLKLHYVAPYWVDYNDKSTIAFIKKFRDYFHTEPENFGFQGYDVTLYFLSALKNYGKEFSECIPYMDVKLIQGDYRFEQVSRFGGYMNNGVSVIYHRPDFEVVRKRILGPQNIARK